MEKDCGTQIIQIYNFSGLTGIIQLLRIKFMALTG